ncbi:MAG: leucyl/phenylalanyl-tRNA--protein transferase [Gammaproteobacteria bacterium]|nr:leucyl/phenylalanyl-tRNA--protein transferase [Gammaproteobacteria bacterium]
MIPACAPPASFPPTDQALSEPNGLLAVGGDLSSERLLEAYRRGIFPWYNEGDPLLWWTPNPRAVLFPRELRISRSLRKRIRSGVFKVRLNCAFEQVIKACAAPRGNDAGTWIDSDMASAYTQLHRLGAAHSFESWYGGELVGGLYGIGLGRVFFGESMFTRQTDASKVALAYLCASGYELIDCQLPTAHLTRLGARLIARVEFEALLARLVDLEPDG